MMRILILLSFFILLKFSFTEGAKAQNTAIFDPIKDNISEKIPPLAVLLDSAVNYNAYIKFRKQQIAVNECKLKAKRVEWTRNLGIQGNAGYGNLYNYSLNSTGELDPSAVATSRSEYQYRASFYINMPLNTPVDRRNQIKLAEIEVEQAESMLGFQTDEVRQTVIRQYNDLILKQRILRVKSTYLETARLNLQMVEKEFQNGVTPINEFSRISQIFYNTESEYETARMEFLTAYMILEELVGMKFNLNNQIAGPNEDN